MNINEFIKKNNIAIVARADLSNKSFEIIKRDLELESYDLFEQLIIYGTVDNLVASTEGQILPRIWTQGKSKCVITYDNNEHIVALFYENSMDAKENYFYAKQLDLLLKEVI
ncbi:hypothetical protein [Butyrivibrio sp. INlla21]|uniref:hypothetical protein n=1 Tax=Butyrivibrio sp. INlla21 TaxID=1520811 RepID=UPI0008E62CE8|nr:hypothetical protein [Butyrivibrio sp. INlla21]SFU55401.1 hypothetical protein SAMN02910342_00913 [Butyrivibrio sp. INlla21]